jgi:hypothetical protein
MTVGLFAAGEVDNPLAVETGKTISHIELKFLPRRNASGPLLKFEKYALLTNLKVRLGTLFPDLGHDSALFDFRRY